MTLEQVKARHPILGWEKRYSAPEMTTDALVDELYREFSSAASARNQNRITSAKISFDFAAALVAECACRNRPAQRGPAAPAGNQPEYQRYAPIDTTGNWVSIVTEDWQQRMITPKKGDYSSIYLNPAGTKIADAWDPAKDTATGEACRSYAAPALLRVPGRLHISWQDNGNTLRIDTDAGQQTRLLQFYRQRLRGKPDSRAIQLRHGITRVVLIPSASGSLARPWGAAARMVRLTHRLMHQPTHRAMPRSRR